MASADLENDMQLYSFAGGWPQPLPWEIFVGDPDRPGERKSRTDPTTFTEEEIADAGGVAVADPDHYDPDTLVLGWDGTAWTFSPATPPPAPATVSAFQARAVLLRAGLLPAVEAAVAASEDAEARLAWEYAVEFVRNGPLLTAIAGQIGLTAAQIDDLFRMAASIQA